MSFYKFLYNSMHYSAPNLFNTSPYSFSVLSTAIFIFFFGPQRMPFNSSDLSYNTLFGDSVNLSDSYSRQLPLSYLLVNSYPAYLQYLCYLGYAKIFTFLHLTPLKRVMKTLLTYVNYLFISCPAPKSKKKISGSWNRALRGKMIAG